MKGRTIQRRPPRIRSEGVSYNPPASPITRCRRPIRSAGVLLAYERSRRPPTIRASVPPTYGWPAMAGRVRPVSGWRRRLLQSVGVRTRTAGTIVAPSACRRPTIRRRAPRVRSTCARPCPPRLRPAPAVPYSLPAPPSRTNVAGLRSAGVPPHPPPP